MLFIYIYIYNILLYTLPEQTSLSFDLVGQQPISLYTIEDISTQSVFLLEAELKNC